MLHILYVVFIIIIGGICLRITLPILIWVIGQITQVMHSMNNGNRETGTIENNYAETEPIKTTHGIPAVLSFFVPGLGQLIKGQVGKALLFFVIGIPIGIFFMWTIVVPLIICAFSAIDAYSTD